jgi:hypothetical protein
LAYGGNGDGYEKKLAKLCFNDIDIAKGGNETDRKVKSDLSVLNCLMFKIWH